MYHVFIDGSAGTTGLRIRERLAGRTDISLMTLDEEQRKNPIFRRQAINDADIVFLCLPDEAALQAVSMIESERVKVLDTSTAHRTNPDWVYGFPELTASQAERIAAAKRVAVPGCHASGVIALARPLIERGLMTVQQRLVCHSLTGYSGGGKKMIAEYEGADKGELLCAPRPYGLSQRHKHLPEMQQMTGLARAPIFCPVVDDYYSGMLVTIGLFGDELPKGCSIADVRSAYAAHYSGPIVRYCEDMDEAGFLSAGALSGKDSMQLGVFGNEERMLLAARYDNLGKGASGAAIQCMNLMLGVSPASGLNL